MATPYKLEQLGNHHCKLGEGPHWDEARQCLYFVDIEDASVGRFDPVTETFHKASVAEAKHVGFIIPVKDATDEFVIGMDTKISVIRWDGSSGVVIVKDLCDLEGPEHSRINDGKADFNGRLVTGTMMIDWASYINNPKGVLVSLSHNKDKEPVTLLSEVGLSNGLAWNREKGTMYYADSLKYNIKEYPYNEKTGQIGEGRIVFEVSDTKHNLPSGVVCDGMTIDTQGHLWVALFFGSRVIKVDVSTGNILQTIPIPTPQVTSVCWGGKNLDELYVTSCAQTEGHWRPPPAGAIFKVTGLGAKGYPNNSFDLKQFLGNC